MSIDSVLIDLEGLIEGYEYRRRAQRESSGGGVQDHVYINLTRDWKAFKLYKKYLTDKMALGQMKSAISSVPSSTASTSSSLHKPRRGDNDGGTGTHDAKGINRPFPSAMEPSRAQVIKQASGMLLKSVKRGKFSKMKSPYSQPHNVNYLAPDVKHRYRGGLRVIQ